MSAVGKAWYKPGQGSDVVGVRVGDEDGTHLLAFQQSQDGQRLALANHTHACINHDSLPCKFDSKPVRANLACSTDSHVPASLTGSLPSAEKNVGDGAADRAGALHSGLAVLHREALRVFLPGFLFALDTICHSHAPFLLSVLFALL